MNPPSVPWRVVAMVIAVVVIVLAAVAILRIARPGSPSASSGSPLPDSLRTTGALTAEEAGRRFLSAYVEPDGRVVRRDQDGDTVSKVRRTRCSWL